jgi:hypothetical protein
VSASTKTTHRLPSRWRGPAIGAVPLAIMVALYVWLGRGRPSAGRRAEPATAERQTGPNAARGLAALPRAMPPSGIAAGHAAPVASTPWEAGPERRLPPPALAATATSRLSPDLLADLEGRVGPVTQKRLESARNAARAFAQRLDIEGTPAQGIADVFTQLALDVAQAEQDTAAASDERRSAVQKAAQDAIDALRWIVPATALPQAEQEIGDLTGGVPVTFTYPAPKHARTQTPLP